MSEHTITDEELATELSDHADFFRREDSPALGELLDRAAAALRAERAKVARLCAVLDDIYPSLASRAMQLQDAGEEVAAEHWSAICRKVAGTWAVECGGLLGNNADS